MFSVYGRAGLSFRGSLEELRQIGPVARITRTRGMAAVGTDPWEQARQQAQQIQAANLPVDVAHRQALDSYAQVAHMDVVRQPLTEVSAILTTPVVVIADTATVEQAWHTLIENHIGQAPVVDAGGVLVGLLGRAELMRQEHLPAPESHALVWRALLLQPVVDVMWTPTPSVAANTDIRRVARVLLDTGLPGLPVVDDAGLVVGFVSRSDILRAVVADPPLDLWT